VDDVFKEDITVSGPRFPQRIPGLETRPKSMQETTPQKHLGIIRERTGSCIVTAMPQHDVANVSQRPNSEGSSLDRLAGSQNTRRYWDKLTKTGRDEIQGKFEPVPSTSTSGNLSPHTNRIQSLYPISNGSLNLPKTTEESVTITEENPVREMNFEPPVDTERDVGGN